MSYNSKFLSTIKKRSKKKETCKNKKGTLDLKKECKKKKKYSEQEQIMIIILIIIIIILLFLILFLKSWK